MSEFEDIVEGNLSESLPDNFEWFEDSINNARKIRAKQMFKSLFVIIDNREQIELKSDGTYEFKS